MADCELALLFTTRPEPVLDHLGDKLNARLSAASISLEESGNDSDQNSAVATFASPAHLLEIDFIPHPLAAETLSGAIDNPISAPFRGPLGEVVAHHQSHMLIRVRPRDTGEQVDVLDSVRIAHAAGTLLAQSHGPAAVHWRPTNQLLTGLQYAGLADELTPWVLTARARANSLNIPGARGPLNSLELEGAAQLIGRPVVFAGTELPVDEIHAASLSFLRHALENGEAIPDGHTFGPRDSELYRVKHIAPDESRPKGAYELSAVASGADTTPDDPARSSGVTKNLTATQEAAGHERARSLAIGYLMLVIMPPIGALLMISNALFGSSSWRTGILATAALGAAMVLGAYTFLNISTDPNATFSQASAIDTSVLEN